MSITALPTPPARTDEPATFVTRADAFVAALPTLVTEINAAMPSLYASDGGLPISVPYTFSTTTSGDPGAGGIRLNNATQSSSTAILIDYTSAASGNPDIRALHAWIGASTSTSSKGVVKIYKTADSTKYLYFNVTASADSTGYYTLTCTCIAQSAASPLTNSDAVTVQFWRTGDAGTAGDMANGALTNIKTASFYQVLATGATTGTININWSTAQNYSQAEPTGDITYTFTAPPGPCHLQLIIASDGTSTARNISFSGMTIRWLGATFSATTANKAAIINLFYDGSTYWAQGVSEA